MRARCRGFKEFLGIKREESKVEVCAAMSRTVGVSQQVFDWLNSLEGKRDSRTHVPRCFIFGLCHSTVHAPNITTLCPSISQDSTAKYAS